MSQSVQKVAKRVQKVFKIVQKYAYVIYEWPRRMQERRRAWLQKQRKEYYRSLSRWRHPQIEGKNPKSHCFFPFDRLIAFYDGYLLSDGMLLVFEYFDFIKV